MKSFIIGFVILVSTYSFANNLYINNSEFLKLYDAASKNGSCTVSVIKNQNTTFFIPSDPSNSKAKFNVLGWGNGTGNLPSRYSKVLESVASHCIIVAAANTKNSGSGKEIYDSVLDARNLYSSIISNKTCTSGHSQGGGGSYNATNLLNSNCVISLQADTQFTTKIHKPLLSHVEVIALWSSSDALAPADPANFKNVDRNSSILTSIETFKENHSTILKERGGNIGTMFRMAAIAQLSPDLMISKNFRRAFWGPDNSSTSRTDSKILSEVFRDDGARSLQR